MFTFATMKVFVSIALAYVVTNLHLVNAKPSSPSDVTTVAPSRKPAFFYNYNNQGRNVYSNYGSNTPYNDHNQHLGNNLGYQNSGPHSNPHGDSYNNPLANPHGNSYNNPSTNPHGNSYNNPLGNPHGNTYNTPSTNPHGDSYNNPLANPHDDSYNNPLANPHDDSYNNPLANPHGNSYNNPSTNPHGNSYNNPSTNPHGNSYNNPSTNHHGNSYNNPSTNHHGNSYNNPSTNPHGNSYNNPSTNPYGNHPTNNHNNNPYSTGVGGSGYGYGFNQFRGSSCPNQTNHNDLHRLSDSSIGYPTTEIANELVARPDIAACLLRQASNEGEFVVPPDFNLGHTRDICPSYEYRVLSYTNTAASGRCWLIQNVQAVYTAVECINHMCSHCENIFSSNTGKLCIKKYKIYGVYAYCDGLPLNQRIIYDKVLIPSSCHCTQVNCNNNHRAY